ncbi:stage II sporulation protein E [Pseudalkalibacillus hwajinpoensis]|uniref:stage II sporulation protein E n=1 Tax=Guptibacillus hwajinpoensis TaxID=208199 RepID=UPI00325BB995
MQSELVMERSRSRMGKWIQGIKGKLELILFQRGLLLFAIGFLLGRAVILTQVTPFAIPFFGAVFFLKRDRAPMIMVSLLAGAVSTSNLGNTAFIMLGILVFLIINRFVKLSSLSLVKTLPILVFTTSMLGRLILSLLTERTLANTNWILAVVEGALGMILTIIFIQSIPVLSMKKRTQALKNEEIISFIILLATMLTGTIGWVVYGFSIENILSRYLVLMFAYVGGAAIGSTVGVVTGLILALANVTSLYQMSMLAFSGLLGGLLKDGRKIGVGLGLLIGTLLIALYGSGPELLYPNLMESAIAILLFFCTPSKITSQLSKYIPGTVEHANEQQQYLRKVRDVTANRVEQFSSLFQALSRSFTDEDGQPDDQSEREIDYFLSHVTEKTCQTCFKKETCWAKNFDTTYQYMTGIMKELEHTTELNNHSLKRDFDKHCNKSSKVIDIIGKEMSHYHANRMLKKQVRESRKIVADQLLGVSHVMGDFAKEIQKERDNLHQQEEQIMDAIQSMGLEVGQIEIYSLEEGNVDIEMKIPACGGRGEGEKVIAPMLSDILKENIIVKKEVCAEHEHETCHLYFASARDFIVETGVANAAKGGAWISGDSHSTIELGAGKYAIAISDGMGNGERAHQESTETIQLLQKILHSGIDETVAIKSVNSVLSLRNTDEIFSTLDLAMIDLQDASAKFLKIGSIPSFIKRGDRVLMVESGNLPMGIIPEFDVEVVSEQLKAGDLLIMMSDGIYEGVKNIENPEFWMKRKIRELATDKPQEIADLIMEEVIRTEYGRIDDDMTIVVARVKRNIPKWSTIPIYSAPSFRKKKAQ